MSEIKLLGPGNFSRSISFRGMYSDNTPYIKLPDFDAEAVDTMVYQHSDTTGFVAAMFLADSIRSQGGKIETLVIPYVPGARQDRINPTGDLLFAAKGFANMINAGKFSRVIILDPHSEVIANKIKKSVVFPLSEVAAQIPHEHYTGIIAPDRGAGRRALQFAAEYGLGVTLASKERDVSTGALTGFSVNVKPGRYLVVDDICDGGGTFVGLGEKIAEQGAIADLYVTHGIFSKGTRKLHELYHEIYTTDSFPQDNDDRVNTIPIVERMIEHDTNV